MLQATFIKYCLQTNYFHHKSLAILLSFGIQIGIILDCLETSSDGSYLVNHTEATESFLFQKSRSQFADGDLPSLDLCPLRVLMIVNITPPNQTVKTNYCLASESICSQSTCCWLFKLFSCLFKLLSLL